MKTVIKMILPLAAVAALSACNDYDLQTLATEEYHKVLSFQEAQDAQFQDVTLYDASEDVTMTFKVLKGGSDPDAPCTMRVESMTQAELSVYGVDYTAVPRSFYTVDGEASFSAGEPSRDVKVIFSKDGLKKMKSYAEEVDAQGKELVLGLKIESDDATVDPDMGRLFRMIDVSNPVFTHHVSGVIGLPSLTMKCPSDRADINASGPSLSFTLTGTDNAWDSEFTVKYRPDLVDGYNAAYGTSYGTLPEDGPVSVPSTVSLPSGENTATVRFSIDSDRLDAPYQFLYPVEITNSRFATDLENDVYYIIFQDEVALSVSDLSSPCTQDDAHGGIDGGGLPALLDNSNSDTSFWSSLWRQPYINDTWHCYIDVRFPEAMQNGLSLQYWNRNYEPVNPTEIEIWVTTKDSTGEFDDPSGWVMLGSFDREDGLPVTGTLGSWVSPAYSFSEIKALEGKPVKYLRFVIVQSNQGLCGTAGVSTAFDELKIYGN